VRSANQAAASPSIWATRASRTEVAFKVDAGLEGVEHPRFERDVVGDGEPLRLLVHVEVAPDPVADSSRLKGTAMKRQGTDGGTPPKR
jgi:hypothetical protein